MRAHIAEGGWRMPQNRLLVPESRSALDAWKAEIASELGIFGRETSASDDPEPGEEFAAEFDGPIPAARGTLRPDWRYVASRDAGAVGGRITRRLVRLAQRSVL